MLTKKHTVQNILGSPVKDSMRVGECRVSFYSIPVIMHDGTETYPSHVTFNTKAQAENLKKGDIFYR